LAFKNQVISLLLHELRTLYSLGMNLIRPNQISEVVEIYFFKVTFLSLML